LDIRGQNEYNISTNKYIIEIQYGLITMYPPTWGHLHAGMSKNRLTATKLKNTHTGVLKRP